MNRNPKKFVERQQKKQVKKALGMLKRIAVATENGDDEELDRVKKDYQAWRARFKNI